MQVEHDPVVDSIESRQFQYSSTYLKAKLAKFPNQVYFQVLNVYLTYTQGAHQEAVQNCSKLLKSLNNDPRCTDLLYKMLAEQGKPNEANEVYESVLKRYPNSNDLMMQWMKNSVKFQCLKSLQKSTFQLAKLHPDSKYKYWSALSNYLLAKDLTDARQTNLFVKLGLKIIESFEPATTHELYVHVLLWNEVDKTKSIEAIQAFSLPLDLDMKILYLQTLNQLGDFETLLKVSQKLLFEENFNDYNTWKLYVISSVKTGVVFEDIESAIKSYKWSRNSQLALVEASHQYGDSKFIDYVLEYYDKLKGKLCCFGDIKHYFKATDSVPNELISTLEESSKLAFEEVTTSNLNILVNNQKLLQFFGKSGKDFVSFNWDIYKTFLQLCDTKLDTDFYVANELVLINVINSLNEDFTIQNIYKQIMILEYLVSNDPLDYKVNLWLMKLYKYTGLIPQLYAIVNKLKIKMVQYDSLGFLAINNVSCHLPSKEYTNFLEYVYRYYMTCEIDLQENIIRAFDSQVYNKLPNFISFNTKILNSYQYFEVILEINKILKGSSDKRYKAYYNLKLQQYGNRLQNTILTDNRDLLIFYKDFSFSDDFISQLEAKFIEQYDQHAYLKTCYLQEMLISEFNEATFKKFNKVSSNLKLPKFEGWVMKVYTSLFKLQLKNLNENEFKSCINYLTKNLKFQKVPPPVALSKDVNYQANIMLNLIKYIESLSFNKVFKDIVPLNKSLALNFDNKQAKQQMEDLTTMHDQLKDTTFDLDVTSPLIDELFAKFQNTLELCSYRVFHNVHR